LAAGKPEHWAIAPIASRPQCLALILRQFNYILKSLILFFKKILDVQVGEAPAFDRPSLNISVRAWATPGDEDRADDEHWEMGFLTVKPAREQTGFVEQKKEIKEELSENDGKRDLVALELVSNIGELTIY
jgi:hypothetical protein